MDFTIYFPVIALIVTLSIPVLFKIIEKLIRDKSEDVDYWSNLTQVFKERGDDCFDRLKTLEEDMVNLKEKMNSFQTTINVLGFKYKVSINYSKDLLKFIKKNELEGEPFIPSEIEDDFEKKEETKE